MPGYGGSESLSNTPAQETRQPVPEPDGPVTRGGIVMRFVVSLLATLVVSAVLMATLVFIYRAVPAAASAGMSFFLLVIGLGSLSIIWTGLHQKFSYEAWQAWQEKKDALQPAWPEMPELGPLPAQNLLIAATKEGRDAGWYSRHVRTALDIEYTRATFEKAWHGLEFEKFLWGKFKPKPRWGWVFYPDWRRERDEWDLRQLSENMAGKAMAVEETGKALMARQEEFRASLAAA